MAAQVAFEEELVERRVSGETIRATLSRLLAVRWQRAKRWITSPDPLYERKKRRDRLMEVAQDNPETWALTNSPIGYAGSSIVHITSISLFPRRSPDYALGMMSEGRGCCDFSGTGVPAEEGDQGICVCEFEEVFGMGQSKVSYHIKKLKDAGLVREERRGKWSFYSLDREAAGELLGEAADRLLATPEKRRVSGGGCC
jgi:ArsR family transcriptional regulator